MNPFENYDEQDFRTALNPKNWTETVTLHTPTLEAVLDENKELDVLLPSGHRGHLNRSDVEAITRFLIEHANVAPLVSSLEDPFEGFNPQQVSEEMDTSN